MSVRLFACAVLTVLSSGCMLASSGAARLPVKEATNDSAPGDQRAADLGALSAQLQSFAKARGVIASITMEESVQVERHLWDAPTTTTHCTAAATISEPDQIPVELSVHVSSCAQAAEMLENAITEYAQPG